MTQCNWCGLMSADDKVCSWCGRVLVPGALPPESTEAPKSNTLPWLGLLAGIVLAIILTLMLTSRGDEGLSHRAAQGSVRTTPNGVPIPTGQAGSQTSPHVLGPPGSAPAGSGTPSSQPRPESDLSASGQAAPNATQGQTGEAADAAPQAAQVRILDARLATRTDADGNEVAGGRVIVLNSGSQPITDFVLTLQADGTGVALTPFEGSPDQPEPFTRRTIDPGVQLEIPVMTSVPYPAGAAVKNVVIRATVAGGSVTDSLRIP